MWFSYSTPISLTIKQSRYNNTSQDYLMKPPEQMKSYHMSPHKITLLLFSFICYVNYVSSWSSSTSSSSFLPHTQVPEDKLIQWEQAQKLINSLRCLDQADGCPDLKDTPCSAFRIERENGSNRIICARPTSVDEKQFRKEPPQSAATNFDLTQLYDLFSNQESKRNEEKATRATSSDEVPLEDVQVDRSNFFSNRKQIHKKRSNVEDKKVESSIEGSSENEESNTNNNEGTILFDLVPKEHADKLCRSWAENGGEFFIYDLVMAPNRDLIRYCLSKQFQFVNEQEMREPRVKVKLDDLTNDMRSKLPSQQQEQLENQLITLPQNKLSSDQKEINMYNKRSGNKLTRLESSKRYLFRAAKKLNRNLLQQQQQPNMQLSLEESKNKIPIIKIHFQPDSRNRRRSLELLGEEQVEKEAEEGSGATTSRGLDNEDLEVSMVDNSKWRPGIAKKMIGSEARTRYWLRNPMEDDEQDQQQQQQRQQQIINGMKRDRSLHESSSAKNKNKLEISVGGASQVDVNSGENSTWSTQMATPNLLMLLQQLEHNAKSQEQATPMQCEMRQYTYKATNSDSSGNKCVGFVTASICYGSCDTGEIADWLFPHKKSIHKVCQHGVRAPRKVLLAECNTEKAAASLREYHFVDALSCVCKSCNSDETTCSTSLTRPLLRTTRLMNTQDTLMNTATKRSLPPQRTRR